MLEIVVPQLHEMRTAHVVSIGSETLSSLNPDWEDGYVLFPLESFFNCIDKLEINTTLKSINKMSILWLQEMFKIDI